MNFSTGIEIAQLAAYGLASVLYLVFHLLGFHADLGPSLARWGRRVFALAFALHFVDIGARCFRSQHPLSSTSEATAFVAWLLALGFLLATTKNRLAAIGAFAAPTVLVLLVLARVVPHGGTTAFRGPLATTHVLLSTVGEALFALAAILATLYLIQERRLKRKDFARMRSRAA